jgi:hypothetical protein
MSASDPLRSPQVLWVGEGGRQQLEDELGQLSSATAAVAQRRPPALASQGP